MTPFWGLIWTCMPGEGGGGVKWGNLENKKKHKINSVDWKHISGWWGTNTNWMNNLKLQTKKKIKWNNMASSWTNIILYPSQSKRALLKCNRSCVCSTWRKRYWPHELPPIEYAYSISSNISDHILCRAGCLPYFQHKYVELNWSGLTSLILPHSGLIGCQ